MYFPHIFCNRTSLMTEDCQMYWRHGMEVLDSGPCAPKEETGKAKLQCESFLTW